VPFSTLVFTGPGPCRRAVFTGSVDRRPWTRPRITRVENDTRVHGPWIRV